MLKIKAYTIFVCLLITQIGISQKSDHYELLVSNDDIWHYRLGNINIPSNWKEADYNVSNWNTGQGGIGYGDGDDNTLISNTISLYMRIEFDLIDTSDITNTFLHADYDDAFVAYLNGQEIARSNISFQGETPSFFTAATDFKEAQLYQGGVPESYRIADKSLLKNGTNVLSIQVHNFTTNSSDLSSNFFLSAGIKNENTYYRALPSWYNRVNFESTLPLLIISTQENEEILDDPKITAHLGVINHSDGMSFPFDNFTGYDGRIGIEIRGTSSQIFDKKGFDIETRNSDGSNNNVELLGLPKENDWILYGPYTDKSLLRNVFSYHLARLTGQYAPRTKFCELIINGEYQGIYVLTEEIKQDKNRVDISKITEADNTGDELTGGYIIKVDRNEENIAGKGWYSTFPDNKFFEFVEPKASDITDAQKTYIQQFMYFFELAMSQNSYIDNYEQYLDLDSWIDYLLVTEISKHIDAYKLSFYMYKDRASKGGKLHMGPLWDINLGYGNFDFECSPEPEGWAYEFPICGSWHPFWPRKITNIPKVQNLTDCRWLELREEVFSTENLINYIDAEVALLGGALDRNYDRWPILGSYIWPNNFVGQDYDEELFFFKQWLIERLEWMDDNMVGDCDQLVNTSDTQANPSIKIYPNPVEEYLYINGLKMVNHPLIFEILNVQGQVVKRIKELEGNYTIKVDDLVSGYYTLIITKTNQETYRLGFIK